MTLSDLLSAPAQLNYNHLGDKDQPAQIAIKAARHYLQELVPPGYLVKQSGVAHNLPFICWIAVLDSDQTTTTQSGIFIVYLYNIKMSKLYLSLNQGFTAHELKAESTEKSKRKASVHIMAMESIISDTRVLKEQISSEIESLDGNVKEIDLGSDKHLAEGYVAGHITGFEYDTDRMPAEAELLKDLESLYPLYAAVCAIADRNSVLNPQSWTTTSGDNEYKRTQVSKVASISYNEFSPKDSSPVAVKNNPNPNQTLFRSRKHEKLLEDFVELIHKVGFTATNKNIGKRDLLIKSSSEVEYLVEAKTVKTDGEEAVRDAIGQLFAYQYEYYEIENRPIPVGLFNMKISELWQGLLNELKTEWVYTHNGNWYASKNLAFLEESRLKK